MSGKITAGGFRIEGRTGLEFLLDNGETKPLSEISSYNSSVGGWVLCRNNSFS